MRKVGISGINFKTLGIVAKMNGVKQWELEKITGLDSGEFRKAEYYGAELSEERAIEFCNKAGVEPAKYLVYDLADD